MTGYLAPSSSDDAPLRVVVVGCGYISQAEHLPNWRQLAGAELAAVVDTRLELAEQVGHAYHVPAFHSLEDALESTAAAAVHICTPPASHVALVELATSAGKHVLVEKPLAMTADDARAGVAAADRAGVVLVVGYPRPVDLDVAYLNDLVRSESLGSLLGLHTVYKISHPAAYVRIGEFERTLPIPAADGSQADLRWRLLEQSIHHLNLFGQWVGTAMAVTSVRRHASLWAVDLTAPNGLPISHFNAGRSGHGEEISAYFERASVHVRPWSPHLPSTYGEVVVTPSDGDAVIRPILARRNPYVLMLEKFVQQTRSMGDWRTAAEHAVGDLELVDAVVRAWDG